MKSKSVLISSIVLIIGNLYPVYAVIFEGMSPYSAVILYVFETLVIALYTILKMQKVDDKRKWNFPGIPLFMLTYGLFIVFQLGFFLLFTGIWLAHKEIDKSVWSFFHDDGIWKGLIILILSHGYSFYFNYLRKQEYQKTSVGKLMFAPYRRVMIQQAVVIFGGMLLGAIPAAHAYFVVLIAAKIIFDLRAHIKEHKKNQRGADGK